LRCAMCECSGPEPRAAVRQEVLHYAVFTAAFQCVGVEEVRSHPYMLGAAAETALPAARLA
jgi:hypothetical protein